MLQYPKRGRSVLAFSAAISMFKINALNERGAVAETKRFTIVSRATHPCTRLGSGLNCRFDPSALALLPMQLQVAG
jgi:hypothetical protein